MRLVVIHWLSRWPGGCDWGSRVRLLGKEGKSDGCKVFRPFSHDLRQSHCFDNFLQWVILLFCFCDNRFDRCTVIHGEDSAESVGAEVLDKRLEEFFAVLEQPSFEL